MDFVVSDLDDRTQVQQQFDALAAETDRPLCHLSRILAASVDG